MDKMGAHTGAGLLNQWRPRYFILNGSMLYYFKEQNDVDPVGFIMLNDVTAVPATASSTPAATSMSKDAARPVVSAMAAKPAATTTADSKPWQTDSSTLSLYITRGVTATIGRGSFTKMVRGSVAPTGVTSVDRPPPIARASAERCTGKHVTFKGDQLGVSLRSRGPGKCPVVDKCGAGLSLEKGDVLVAVNGEKVIDFPNPMGTSIARIQQHEGPLVLSFISEGTEATICAALPESLQGPKRSARSAVVFQEDEDNKKGGASYLLLVPTMGGKIKSVKYNSTGELVPGIHDSIRLRVASAGIALSWVGAVNEAAIHTTCPI